MASSRGYFSNLFHYVQSKPFTTFCAGCGAYATGSYAATGSIPFFPRAETPVLNTSTFTSYELVAKHKISSSSSIFVLRPPKSDKAVEQLRRVWSSGSCLWSVQAKQPQLQIGREYTPMPPTPLLSPSLDEDADAAADIHLLIRREKKGEMTTYLDALPLSSTISLRGPYQDVSIPPHVDEVLFLAGGTGISPALQVAHILAQRPGAKVHVMWANRKREECLGAEVQEGTMSDKRGLLGGLWGGTSSTKKANVETTEKGLVVKIVEDMKQRVPKDSFQVQYFVDEEDSFIRSREVKRILSTKPGTTSEAGSKFIIVSGPEGFVDYWAGRKRFEEGQERQGPIGGRLGEMDLNGWKVWKL